MDDLKDNNNRPWFTENKPRYQIAQKNLKTFLEDVEKEMNTHDRIEKTKLFRIYRDVRFSKDKTPYNSHWSMSLSREKPYLRGGYYIRINSEGCMLACGFWNPNSSDMAIIRGNIDQNSEPMRKAINATGVVSTFGKIGGETVKTAPKGYSKTHPDIDLIRHKQFIFSTSFDREMLFQKDFAKLVSSSFRKVRPFFDYMSDILGHNLNGEPLY